jgi:protein O-GlcNAc transferase
MKQYLVIKSWGYGFWSDTFHVAGALLLAEISGRTPVTCWGSRSLFNDDAPDAFSKYFRPVSPVMIEDLTAVDGADFYPIEWNASNLRGERTARRPSAVAELLSRTESIIVSDCYLGVPDVAPFLPESHVLHGQSVESVFRYIFGKYFVLDPTIDREVTRFHRINLRAPFIAIHLRGSDKIAEQPDLAAVNASCVDLLKCLDPSQKIFLLTDDAKLLEKMASLFPGRLVHTASQRTNSIFGTHYHRVQSRFSLGREVLIDTYLALKASTFVGNGASNVASVISLLKEWPDGSCHLLSPPVAMRRFA